LEIPNPRQQKRIPFGALLEAGLVQPGQKLFFAKDGITATVLANAHIRCGKLTGSIHGVAKSLLNAPANGWDFWLYENEKGQRIPIDQLRELIRARQEKMLE
jgi:modification methylase